MSRRFTRETMRQAFARSGGFCEFIRDGIRCMAALTPGNRIYDHRDMWEISRDSSLANCQVICTKCDREKTAADAGRIAKTRDVEDYHLGIRGPGLGRRPMPGGRRDRDGRPGKWRKTFRRGVVRRRNGIERHRDLMAKRRIGG